MFGALKNWLSSGPRFDPTRVCSECGSPLYLAEQASERDSACPNLDCPAKIREAIEHWCSSEAMEIKASAELRAMLVKRGLVRDVADLYKLKQRELEKLPGMSPAEVGTLLDTLNASKQRDPWRILFGLRIPRVTVADAQALTKAFGSVDAVFAAGAERLAQQGSVNEEVARSIAQWQGDSWNRRILRKLHRSGFRHV